MIKFMKKRLFTMLTTILICLNSIIITFAGSWQQDAGRYWYQYDDGTKAAEKWEFINGNWYYFRPSGYMATNWTKVNDKWYYLEPTGEMRTSPLITDVFVFYFNADGSCTNFYENTTPSTQAGWANYNTGSLATLTEELVKGNIVYYNGTYWATPDYRNLLTNEKVVSYHDISKDTTPNDRFGFADAKITVPDDKNDDTNSGYVADNDDWDPEEDWDFD